jgi:hypothetical protein
VRKRLEQLSKPLRFQMELYFSSHNSLLLRARESHPMRMNTDVMFFGTIYIEVPMELLGLEIQEATPEDVAYIAGRLGRSPANCDPAAIHVLVSQGRRYYVVGQMRIEENDFPHEQHSLND